MTDPMEIKPDRSLQVGDWQYLPEQDKLVQFDADGKIALTADLDNLSQKVVNYFIVHAGKLITKDELLLDVWGIRDVSDGRVTRVIRVLRVALGDDTREPTYIETIPKRGYRFIAPVKAIVEAAEEQHAEVQHAEPQPVRRGIGLRMAAWLVPLFIGIAAISWLFWPVNNTEQAEQAIPLLRYTPVTSLDGLEFYHNVSEDERYLVYSYASPENENVTVLMLEDLQEHKRIQFTEPSFSSFGAAFSPNTKQIAYHRYYPNGRCSIRLAEFDAKAFAVINDIELTECGENSPSSRVSWSPDAKYIIYPTMNANRQMVLMMKPVKGGAAEQLTNPPPSSFGDYAARFSFKGDKLAFLRGSGSSAQLWMLDLSSREIKMLVNVSGTLPGNVGWSADDRSVIYSSAPTVINQVDAESGLTSVIAFTDFGTREIQTTKNEKLYASVGNFAHINIKKVLNELKADTGTEFSEVVFSSNRNESFAEAHPNHDGPIAVVSRRSGLPQVWLFYPNGDQRQLTFFEKNERIRSLIFAPNGEDLLLQRHNEIWLLSDAGELTRVPHSDNLIVSSPAWGNTGEYVYYAESINGRWQIARYSLTTRQIDSEPFALDQELYLESYDGKYSFWRDAVSKKFYIKWLATGIVEELPILLPENQLWFKFQAKATGIYYTELLEDVHFKLKYYDFSSKKILDVFKDELLYHSRFTVSADEKNILFLQSVRGDLDIGRLTLP